MIKVLIADAQLLVREGLKSILSTETDIEVVCEAEDRQQLLSCLKKIAVDVVIIDYSFESKFRVSDIQSILQLKNKKVSVLIISSDNKRENIYEVINFGTHGFLTKECDRMEVLDAIRATAQQKRFFCSKIVNIVLEKDNNCEAPPILVENCDPTLLTAREMEVLEMIGKGLKTNEIATQLNLSVHTINTHRKNIGRKLNAGSAAQLMKYALTLT